MNHETITLPITINGETREVQFRVYATNEGKMIWSVGSLGLFQKRAGQKCWPQTLFCWKQADGSYKLSTQTTILNRTGYRLIGWANEGQNFSNHNSASVPL